MEIAAVMGLVRGRVKGWGVLDGEEGGTPYE